MGSADVIPGVSGGTVAFITGIYEELLDTIALVNAENLRLFIQLRWKLFWQRINGNFLLALGLGLVLAWTSLARLMKFVLERYPISTWSFFFGLIVISGFLVLRQIRRFQVAHLFVALAGAAAAYGLSVLAPSQTPDSLIFVFFSGAIAICAMILPGISGAFILLLLGKYEFILTKIFIEVDLAIILTFGGGCLLGLWLFARVLRWVLARAHDVTIALLAGFMFGFLNKIWPWRVATGYYLSSTGEQKVAFDKSVWPTHYLEATGQNPYVLHALLFASLGIVLVVALEKVSVYLRAHSTWKKNSA